MFPEQKKIELFARREFPGWQPWGLETALESPVSAPEASSAPATGGTERLLG